MDIKFRVFSATNNLAKVKTTLKKVADNSQKTLDSLESMKHNPTVSNTYSKVEAKRDLAVAVLEALDGKFVNLNLEAE